MSAAIHEIAAIAPVVLALFLAACVPATVPSQLAHTPGPAVVLSGQIYDSGTFQVEYPVGWRVITSAAGDPVSVIFAAPEGDALIMLGETIADAPSPADYEGDLRSERREIVLDNEVTVIAVLKAASEQWAAWQKTFVIVAGSLRLSSPPMRID